MQKWINRRIASLDDLLVEVYSTSQQNVRAIFLPLVYNLRRVILFLLRGLTLEVYELNGPGAHSGRPLKVIYFVEGKGMSYLTSQLFGEGPLDCAKIGKVRAWQLASEARRLAKAADLLVVEQNTLLGWRPPHGRWVSAPTWVRMSLELERGKSWQQIEQSFKKHERNIRRMKRAGFTYKISRSPEDFEYFYERMHVPLVMGRHQGYGFVDAKAHLFSLFQHGFLLLVLDAQGRVVGGDLAALYGDMYYGVASGVLDNDPELLDAGVVSAIYYYALQWCYDNQIRACDIGEVRPFVDNGLYQYKRRWGFQPVRELWNTREWLFWAPNASPEALGWLEDNPTIPEFTAEARPQSPGEPAPAQPGQPTGSRRTVEP